MVSRMADVRGEKKGISWFMKVIMVKAMFEVFARFV